MREIEKNIVKLDLKIKPFCLMKFGLFNPIRGRNFCVKDQLILKLKVLLISISNVGTYKFENQCLITQSMLSLQGQATMGYRKVIK